jgi:hypothetical protein
VHGRLSYTIAGQEGVVMGEKFSFGDRTPPASYIEQVVNVDCSENKRE